MDIDSRGYTAFVSICFYSVILDTVKGTRDSLSRFRERIMRNAGHNTSLLRSLIALVGISSTWRFRTNTPISLLVFYLRGSQFPNSLVSQFFNFYPFSYLFLFFFLDSSHNIIVTNSSNHGTTILSRDE